MDRKLLLLGLLRMKEMHGYQLNDFLATFLSVCVDVKKSTAYYLLNKMHQDGWIAVEEQQDGNRPVRRIYRITENGEFVFQNLLRENLTSYSAVQFDGDIGLAFMDAIPGEELSLLLSQRREDLEQKLAAVDAVPEHPRSFQLIIEHQARHLRAELQWLDEVIDRM